MRFTNIDVNEKVNLFNKTTKNIIRNYISHETITCDDRDQSWINKDIRELIHEKKQAYKSYRQNKNNIFSCSSVRTSSIKVKLSNRNPTITLAYLKNYQIPQPVRSPTGLY